MSIDNAGGRASGALPVIIADYRPAGPRISSALSKKAGTHRLLLGEAR
jgi:hypothetical protein